MNGSDHVPVIVAGVDGSDDSTAVLHWAADYARATGGRLRAVFAWRPPDLANLVPFRVEADLERAAEKRLHELVATSVRGLPVETAVMEGSPGRVLLRAAADADLLVIGGHRAGVAPGGVMLQCAAGAPCPMTIVPVD